MSGSPNPFDFSDFQSQGSQFPAGGGTPGAFGGGSFGGGPSPLDQSPSFDPFAGPSTDGPGFGGEAPFGGPVAGADQLGQGQGLFSADEVAGPPVLWCGIAAATALIGLALAILGSGSIAIAVAGWLVAGPLAIGLLAVYTTLDTKARTKPFYTQPGWTVYSYWVVLVVALAGVIVGALRIAYWAGTR